jgi:hypothetical protein
MQVIVVFFGVGVGSAFMGGATTGSSLDLLDSHWVL